ncbi:PREDICTED: uncharacterized protein LOC109350542 [Lupinus angustifolius]|uniref:uncharacterized protein LOC109350542 n=1 Tax=Lupinus angustifolius TaxID=3871 RepID=UPI00092ECE63|nr:PREDICTED: uncharacterized protein LOC109350542 [Lupinus angustifolius]
MAVWSCAGDKSPGPDGFNFRFFQDFWEVVKDDIILFIQEFHANGKIPKGLNSSFIALIPKTKNPNKIQDYMSISLVRSLYKILSKILAGRLKGVMSSLISPSQSAFVHDRYILDAVVVINEVIHSANNNGDGCILFKVDFEKAYDSVDWTFLDNMLSRFGFSNKWRNWVNACLSSTSMSVLINGSPTTQFSISRGIRQGDPMAPFMFLMVVEGFAGLVRRARSIGVFDGFKIGRGDVEVCDLQFVDDTIIVCKLSDNNLWCLKTILRCFELVSGLEGANPRKMSTWQGMNEVISKRLAERKCKHITFGGRLILLNSVLSNIPTYMLSLYKAPKKVLAKFFSLQRKFLWGNKRGGKGVAWVAWTDVCKPKELGGLDVRDISHFNDALLGKWRWRRLQKSEAFSVKVINSKYSTDFSVYSNNSASRWWKDLGKVGSSTGEGDGWFVDNIWKEIENDLQTLFWHDVWVGTQSLKVVYPRLFNLAQNQNAWVGDNDHWDEEVWVWDCIWRRSLFGREETLATDLYVLIHNHSCKRNSLHTWKWGLDGSGDYVVKSGYLTQLNQQSSPLADSHSDSVVFVHFAISVHSVAYSNFAHYANTATPPPIPCKRTLRELDISEQLFLQYFYERLNNMEGNIIDAANRVTLGNMSPFEARGLVEKISSNSQQFSARSSDAILQKPPLARVCDNCTSIDHYVDVCPSLLEPKNGDHPEAYATNVYNNRPQQQQQNNDPSSSRNNHGWMNHMNLRWSNPSQPPPEPPF